MHSTHLDLSGTVATAAAAAAINNGTGGDPELEAFLALEAEVQGALAGVALSGGPGVSPNAPTPAAAGAVSAGSATDAADAELRATEAMLLELLGAEGQQLGGSFQARLEAALGVIAPGSKVRTGTYGHAALG